MWEVRVAVKMGGCFNTDMTVVVVDTQEDVDVTNWGMVIVAVVTTGTVADVNTGLVDVVTAVSGMVFLVFFPIDDPSPDFALA